MSLSPVDALVLQRTFAASPERVFAAWTDPRLLQQWWGPPGSTVKEVEIDFRVGGRYRIGILQPDQAIYFVTGTYLTIWPPTRLAFSWRWENPEMDIGRSQVTIEFRESGDKTDLKLTHERLPTKETRKAHGEGWMGMLEELAQFLSI